MQPTRTGLWSVRGALQALPRPLALFTLTLVLATAAACTTVPDESTGVTVEPIASAPDAASPPPAATPVPAVDQQAIVDQPPTEEAATETASLPVVSEPDTGDSEPPPADTAPEPTPEPALSSIGELVALYGEPPGIDFARLRIPVLGVNAPVRASTVGSGEGMVAPHDPVAATWYDMRNYPGMGGSPGAGGNAIFSGHVDFGSTVDYAGVPFLGPGVFGALSLLSVGDVIEIDMNGSTLRYAVAWRKQVDAVSGDWASIWSADVPVDSITLYTCAGQWDSASHSYADRMVIRAERID